MPDDANEILFDAEGALRRELFDSDALACLDACTGFLQGCGRGVYLPVDLMVVLLERDHAELRKAIARAATGDPASPIVESTRALAERVERHHDDPAALSTGHFSLGFTGILADAWRWASEAGREAVTEADLERVVRWRVELQESASVRWAIRELAGPSGGDALFDGDGNLRRAAFDAVVWAALNRGVELSARAGLPFLGTPHLIAALCDGARGVLAESAAAAGVDRAVLQRELLRVVGTRSPAQPEFALHRRTLTPRLARLLLSARESLGEPAGPIDERALLRAFVGDGGSTLEVMRSLGIAIEDALGDSPDGTGTRPERQRAPSGELAVSSVTPTLDSLGRDLTAEARAGTLPEVHGRAAELQRVINVLLRPEQRNPLLTGEAGVGKTAIAAALARRIADGTVPRQLRDQRVVEISGASLLGGTSYRGELEARIKALLSEAETGVILFIDEAHAVFAPRTNSGQPAEVPNHFKAALANGRLAVVAATTEAEYHRWIEQDPALRRRFERIEIPELSAEQTRAILASLAPVYEREYEVPLTPDAVDAAVELSVRFVPEQSLPDKAKKLLMDATIAVASELALRPQAAPEARSEATPCKRVVGREDVARQVALKTGIPLDRVVRGPRGWWVGLEERLNARVVGQEAAVARLCRALVAGRVDGLGRQRAQSVFALLGPQGVGRAALVGALAEELLGSRGALLRLEMSDFAEPHSVSRLIGSPPGYVGYQDEDALVTPLRRRPASVVLLNDFDRAHPRVQERIARMLMDGEIVDTRGLRADVRHAIFALTLTTDAARAPIGFQQRGEPDAAAVARSAAPDVLDRLTGLSVEFILFEGLRDHGGRLAQRLFDARLAQFAASVELEYGQPFSLPAARLADVKRRIAEVRDVRQLDEIFRAEVVEAFTADLLRGPTPTPRTTETSRPRKRAVEPA